MNRWLNCIALLLLMALLFLSNTSINILNGVIDLNALPNYANQPIPNYINKDNTPVNNPITDLGATLGRVLFYDKQLSVNNTISCASCHIQEFGFSDLAQQSIGQSGGLTGRHAMRLINSRFSVEARFFWDERAMTLEDQSTQPIQDHIEMGFSGADGDPTLDSLFRKMETLDYYQLLFTVAYGDATITEERMQLALAQFIRSIQSFDSKYDEGKAMVNNNNMNFPNFTQQENMGKMLFMTGPGNGGAGCNACHRAPEFDIDPISRNNGIIGVAGDPGAVDLTNIRSPSLRDLVNPDGALNGPLMHNGSLATLEEVIEHYNVIFSGPFNNNLDPRLRGGPGGTGQNLNLTDQEKAALVAFLQTLTGSDVYTNEKWADPFDENGDLMVVAACEMPITNTIQAIICEGQNFEGYTETGTYEDTFFTSTGCDSTRTLLLTVLPDVTETINAEICEGDSFEGYTETGTYEDTFLSFNGCDSTRTLILNVAPTVAEILMAEICEGDSYEGYTTTGVYEDIFLSSLGCDSIRTINLQVLENTDPACLASSTDEPLFVSQLQIFPNPFRDILEVNCDCEGTYLYTLYNANGQMLKQQEWNFSSGKIQLSTVDLPQGVYFLNIQEEEGKGSVSRLIMKN